MDPNRALKEMRLLADFIIMAGGQLARGVRSTMPHQETVELAEKFQELDEWMSRGGFPPEKWKGGA